MFQGVGPREGVGPGLGQGICSCLWAGFKTGGGARMAAGGGGACQVAQGACPSCGCVLTRPRPSFQDPQWAWPSIRWAAPEAVLRLRLPQVDLRPPPARGPPPRLRPESLRLELGGPRGRAGPRGGALVCTHLLGEERGGGARRGGVRTAPTHWVMAGGTHRAAASPWVMGGTGHRAAPTLWVTLGGGQRSAHPLGDGGDTDRTAPTPWVTLGEHAGLCTHPLGGTGGTWGVWPHFGGMGVEMGG